MTSRLRQAFLTLGLFLSFTPKVWAWGKIGHRVVGQVGQSFLTEKTKKMVAEILAGQSLADVSNFADEVRSDPHYDEYIPLHFVTIGRGQTYESSLRNAKGDVIVGIEKFSQILKDQSQPMDKRKEALSYLVHLIGDLHQPLHVGVAEDRGGNDIKVQWFGKESNLHKVWDEQMLQFEELSYSEYAAMLERLYPPTKAQEWMNGDARSWASESQNLRDSLYPKAGESDLNYVYHYQHKAIAYQRLYQGGVRVAYQLNLLLGK